MLKPKISFTPAPLPANEAVRLKVLQECQILDTLPEPIFDDVTRLATQICNTPVALVSLVDANRQWFKSKMGLDVTETSRDLAFCAHTILQPEILIVPDALQDQRFANNPLVTAAPHIRFYVGVPLLTTEGQALGTLCVIDFVSRELSCQQLEALQTLGRQVVKLIELRRHVLSEKEHSAGNQLAAKQRQQFFNWVTAGFGIASIILLFIGGVSYRSLNGLVTTSNAAVRSHRVVEKLEQIFSDLKDVEAGQRGYVITGDKSYLAPYDSAVKTIEHEITALRQLTAPNSNQQQQLDTLEQLIAEKLAVSQQIIDLRQNKSFAAAKNLVLSGKGKQLSQQIRATVRELEQQENQLLTQRSLQASTKTRQTIFTFASGIALTCLILAVVYYLIYREIGERQRTEAALKQEQIFTGAVLDTANALVAVLDIHGRIVRFNRACEILSGYTFAEVKGKYIWDLLLPEEVDAVKAVFASLKAGQFSQDQENYWVTRSGDRRLIAWSNTVLCDPFVAAKYIIGIGIDITARQQAEQSLRESEERYRDLFENASDMIQSITPDGRLLYVNQAWRETLGYSEAEISKLSVFDTVHPDSLSHCQTLLQQVIAGKTTSTVEAAFISKDGQKIEVEGSINRKLLDGQPVSCRAIFRNITERKKHQIALQQANQQLVSWVKELEQRNREIALLGELSDVLQACLTVAEAYKVLTQLVPPLFPHTAGGIFARDSEKNLVEAVTTWGVQFAPPLAFASQDCWAMRRGRVHRVQNTHKSSLLCQHHLNCTLPQASLCVPMMAQGQTLGVLHLHFQQAESLTETVQQLAVTVAEHIALALANLHLREKLQHQSDRDPLTGLFNRRYMAECLEKEVRRAEHQQQSLGIIMLDVDHFKSFNDTFGHEAGDLVLRELGRFLQKQIRHSDIACRYGGEELILIIPAVALDVTYQRAEQLRQGIKRLQMRHQHQSLGTLSLSLGVAIFPQHGTTVEALLQAADAAMYCAKQQGRDRVVVAASISGRVGR